MIIAYLKKVSFTKAILLSGLLIGMADAAAAMISAYLSSGVSPHRVWQYVASGAIGSRAYTGGTNTVLLGLTFHFIIATFFTASFFLIASRSKKILNYVFAVGAAYGVLVWLCMNILVVPLSQIPPRTIATSQLTVGLLIHIFVIGIPIVWLAKKHFAIS